MTTANPAPPSPPDKCAPSTSPPPANISRQKPSTPYNKESPPERNIRCPTPRIDSPSISTHKPHVAPLAIQSPQQIKPFPRTAALSTTNSPYASIKMPTEKISPVSTEKPSALLQHISQTFPPSADTNSSTIP